MQFARTPLLVLWLVLTPTLAYAQIAFESTGARALGMAGAFVAVANDPTAIHWNPAGLVRGEPAGLTIGLDRFHFRKPDDPVTADAGRLSSAVGYVGTWPLGLSFGQTVARGVADTTGPELRAESLSIVQFGITVLQTLMDLDAGTQQVNVVVGATPKYLRGTTRITGVSQDLSVAEAFEILDDSVAVATNAFDLDVGILAEVGRLRAGVTIKNLLQPKFAHVAENAIELSRRTRMGLSFDPVDGVTLALDLDLDTADPLVGLRQVIALGGEARLSPRLALRGGMRWPRESGRPIGAFGGSLRVRQSLWIDGYGAVGSRSDQGFGIALRAGMN